MTNYEKQEMRWKTNLIKLREMKGKEQLDFLWNMIDSLTHEVERMEKEAKTEQGNFGKYAAEYDEGYLAESQLAKVVFALHEVDSKLCDVYRYTGDEEYEVY